MSRCITWSTGRRPLTAQASLDAIRVQLRPDPDEFTVVQWHPNGPWNTYDYRRITTDGTNRAVSHNSGLMAWSREHDNEMPDYWFTLDDDIVPCRIMFDRMQAVIDEDSAIGLLGAWNDGSQRDGDGDYFGGDAVVAGEVVQYGVDFNVGGAVQLIPKRTLDLLGPYDPEMTWLEDHDYTQRVRQAGYEAAIARTVFAVVLEDDGIEPTYREEMLALFFKNRKEKLGW